MGDLNPIKTFYNDYHFRSRLEARWAVFFDTLGVKYEYEKEGFDLDGKYYLPDFWLPEFKAWVEIKPDKFEKDSIGAQNIKLMQSKTSDSCWLICGNPYIDSYKIWAYGEWGYEPEGHWWDEFVFVCSQSHVCVSQYCLCLSSVPDIHITGKNGITSIDVCIAEGLRYDHPRIMTAYLAARQARFEHGESGSMLKRGFIHIRDLSKGNGESRTLIMAIVAEKMTDSDKIAVGHIQLIPQKIRACPSNGKSHEEVVCSFEALVQRAFKKEAQ